MYNIFLFAKNIQRASAIANALNDPLWSMRIEYLKQDFKNIFANKKLDCSIFITDETHDFNIVPAKILRLPCILMLDNDQDFSLQNMTEKVDRTFISPFNFSHIVLYIKHLLFSYNDLQPENKLMVSDLILHLDSHQVEYQGDSLFLSNKEFSLLEFLMRNKNKAFTRNEILENVWDRNNNIFTNTVDVHIGKLRRKIDCENPEKFIETLHGFGYLLKDFSNDSPN